MGEHILITGATGMLGKELMTTLLARGYRISILARKPQTIPNVNVYLWDVYRQKIDANCLNEVDSIIHLAGENISKGKWTEKRKKQIIDSRVLSAGLLYQTIAAHKNQVRDFISASAVGYYGDRGEEILNEESAAGDDFLAESCLQWEFAVDQGKAMGLRVVKIRTGVVLSKEEGALPAMATPVKWFAGAALGTGKQWIPWIHHHDMTQIYLHALENKSMKGAYNACAPFPITNACLTKAIAAKLHRPVWPFHVPEKVMKILLGEMSAIVLNSTNTSVQHLLDTGFIFNFTLLDKALSDIYGE
ncbi:TIGR01777 family oxidoreductase [Pedobacter sp. AW31-3R]|uniref:TIGR01777 family oxidoreductase n=1 Tax=Pedobacter sp. AW31-3R TaxID=3445781 RepID=UPI003FA18699